MLNVSYKFELPNAQKSIIKVIGVGGGGSNAVKHMYNQGIKDVDFIICNTDAQALKSSPVPNKLQIGSILTQGLGAGAIPEVGKNAALESKDQIREMLTDTKMLFITAGMGGGTGTGAAPVIAKIARELDILTVGIVTAPFAFEGPKKRILADNGLNELKQYCDTVVVIMNDRLREIYGNLSVTKAFAEADCVLTTAAKSIAEIITVTHDVNVDFNDVRTVMKDSGAAVMGSGVAAGTSRARKAIEDAISSPLLNNTNINGAKRILLSISYGEQGEITMDEITEITDYMYERAGYDADVIFGQGMDPLLGDAVRVTVIATGFDKQNETDEYYDIPNLVTNNAPVTPPAVTVSAPIVEGPRTIIDLESNRTIKVEQDKNDHQPRNNAVYQDPAVVERERIEALKAIALQNNNSYDDAQNNKSQEFIIRDKQMESVPAQRTVREDEMYIKDYSKKTQETENDRRRERLRNLSRNATQVSKMHPDDFKERLEVPAYIRKQRTLQDTPHSSEREISRYNLNDDNEILGNNKFLHDNVD